MLEVTTKTYTTKIEKMVVPPEEVQEDVDMDDPDTKPPALPGGLNVFDSENKVTYADGSSIVCTTEESLKKRIIVLSDVPHIIITTRTCITKIERICLPEESEAVDLGEV
mmetsp:Transcript_295/g.593  ORF Transcript_295/g.593 Transcript_295/m.593 type:complete len:110 (+) Transcript_295:1027-1356(+)